MLLQKPPLNDKIAPSHRIFDEWTFTASRFHNNSNTYHTDAEAIP